MRSLIRTTLLLVTLASPGTLAAQTPRPRPADLARAVDSLAERIVAAGLTPGLGVAVVMDGRTILAKGYGFANATAGIRADDRTLWYIASTSKSFTGFGVTLLAQRGALSFDTPIATLLPAAEWAPGVDPSRLPLSAFLSHTHHLDQGPVAVNAAFTGAVPESEWPRLLRYSTPTGSPDLVYGNLGYNVAAMVIDAQRPEGWRKFLETAIYRPAGLRDTYTRISGVDARRIAVPHRLEPTGAFTAQRFEKADATMTSAGGHLSTMADLARWVTIQMDQGRLDGRQVFPAEAVALGQRPIAEQTVPASRRFAYFDRDAWAAGWDLGRYEGERMVSRFGAFGATRSHLSWLPARHIGVVAEANGVPGGTATDLIAAFAYDLEAGRPDARARADQRLADLVARLGQALPQVAASDSTRLARQRPMDRPLADFAGRYVHPGYGAITLALRDGTLRFSWGVLEGPVEVFDAPTRRLRIEVGGNGTVLAFTFPEQGPAQSLQVLGETFVRSAAP